MTHLPISPWLLQDRLRLLLRWGMASAVLLLVAVLPWVASELVFALLVIGLIGLGAVWLFLQWPPLGLIAAIAGGMIVPFYGPSGLNITMMTLALMLGLWLLEMFTQRKAVSLVPSSTLLPLLVLLTVGCIAFGFGLIPWFAFAQSAPLGAQMASLSVLILSAGAFLLVGNQVRTIQWLQALVWVFLALGALYIAGRAVPELRFFTRQLFQRGMDGSLLWVWITVLAFSQAAFNRDLAPHWRLALIGLFFLTLYVAFVQTHDWKSGWVPPLIGIGATLVAYSWRFGLAMMPFAVIGGIYVGSYLVTSDAYSYSTRIEAWVILAGMITDSPFMGFGWANYRWFTPLFPIRGYAVYFNSHNQYVDIVAQIGVVGLICFVWFFVQTGILGWKLRTRVPAGFPRAYVYGALGGLVATLVAGMLGDWILPFFYNVGLTGFRASVLAWLFLGGLVVLEQIYTGGVEGEGQA